MELSAESLELLANMNTRILSALALIMTTSLLNAAEPKPPQTPLVRIAEIDIDPAQVEAYQAAISEEIRTSVRVEPGVLAIYSVAEKENPSRFHFFEIYADDAAYRSHIQSPQFKKYAAATQTMIRSKKLIETTPIELQAKPGMDPNIRG